MQGRAYTYTWLIGLGMLCATGAARAVDVTNADRVFGNFTRETATLSEGQVRIEVRGLHVEDEKDARLNTAGFRVHDLKEVSGGEIELLGSYGFAKDAEIGFLIPGYVEKLSFENSRSQQNADIGDFLMYGKFQRSVAEHCSVGGGVELTMPNGPESKHFGSGELGMNPFASTRYQRDNYAVGAHVGYLIYTGNADDLLNYSVEGIVRVSDDFALRAEITGREFSAFGHKYNDIVALPGIDFSLTDNITIRPTGLANITTTALDWGIGLGIAAVF